MQNCVIDCSYLLAFLLPDEDNSINLESYTVHIPAIFFLECLNVLKTALKKQRITQDQYDACMWCFKTLPFHVDHFSATPESIQTIAYLSRKNDLTSYDASYLELAIRLNVPLGTCDKKLQDCCMPNKVPLLAPLSLNVLTLP